MSVDGLLEGLTITPVAVAAAALFLLAAWILSRWARRGIRKAASRIEGVSQQTRNLAARTAGYLIMLIGAGFALSALGVHTQPLLIAVILLAIVGGLALRGIADNFAAGVVLQTRHPIRIGDEISCLGETGVVAELNGRSVVIDTIDGRRVHLPNAQVTGNALNNHSTHGARRTAIEVGAYDITPQRLAEALLQAVTEVSTVLSDPAPTVVTTAILSGRTVVQLRIWHHPLRRPLAASDAINAIAATLPDSGIRLTHARLLETNLRDPSATT